MNNEIFLELGFKVEEAETYTTLLSLGPSTASNIAKKLKLPRATLYGYLDKLINGGLVTQSIERNTKIFSPEPTEKIRALYSRKIEHLKTKEKKLDTFLPELEKLSGLFQYRPQMQFYEGREGIQNILEDILKYPNQETYVFWPITYMVEIITPEFLRYHNKMRIKNNIWLRSIWPEEETKKLKLPPYLGSSEKYLREIRTISYSLPFQMGCWIYGNKVGFIASRAENFGVIIESEELIQLLIAQHNILWNTAQPLVNPTPIGAQSFLDEVYENDH